MSTYVLIHGAYHGGWCWEKVIPLLEKHGHNVVCPTLSNKSGTNLSDHIDEVCLIIEKEKLNNIILVGHSYAGLIITGVANKLSDKIAQLVYLDAVVPEGGKSLLKLCNKDSAKKHLKRAKDLGSEFFPSKTAYEYGLESQENVAWASSKYTPQPLKTFTEPLFFDETKLSKIKKTYILCVQDHFDKAASSVLRKMGNNARKAGWAYFELDTGHSAMITVPKGLAEILLNL